MPKPKKLTPAQLKALQEIIQTTDAGFRSWSCVSDYKPALKLLELGYVSKTKSLAGLLIVLVPTELGRSVASSL